MATLSGYITNLGKYNEGELVGKWIELPIDEDDFEDYSSEEDAYEFDDDEEDEDDFEDYSSEEDDSSSKDDEDSDEYEDTTSDAISKMIEAGRNKVSNAFVVRDRRNAQ